MKYQTSNNEFIWLNLLGFEIRNDRAYVIQTKREHIYVGIKDK